MDNLESNLAISGILLYFLLLKLNIKITVCICYYTPIYNIHVPINMYVLNFFSCLEFISNCVLHILPKRYPFQMQLEHDYMVLALSKGTKTGNHDNKRHCHYDYTYEGL